MMMYNCLNKVIFYGTMPYYSTEYMWQLIINGQHVSIKMHMHVT